MHLLSAPQSSHSHPGKVTAAGFGGTQEIYLGRKGPRGSNSPRPQEARVFPLKGGLIEHSWPSPGRTVPSRRLQATTCTHFTQTFIEHLLCRQGLPTQQGRQTAGEGEHGTLHPEEGGPTESAVTLHPAPPAGPPCHAGPLCGRDRLCAPSGTLKSNIGGRGGEESPKSRGKGS